MFSYIRGSFRLFPSLSVSFRLLRVYSAFCAFCTRDCVYGSSTSTYVVLICVGESLLSVIIYCMWRACVRRRVCVCVCVLCARAGCWAALILTNCRSAPASNNRRMCLIHERKSEEDLLWTSTALSFCPAYHYGALVQALLVAA